MQILEQTLTLIIKALSTLIRFQTKTGVVLLRFQKDFRPHLLFSYRFRLSKLQRRIRFENAFIPSMRMLNELNACAFQYIGPRNWREIAATW